MMNEQNDFERQVEREEAQYSEPGQVEREAPAGAVNDLVEKIKELVRKGNVTKIVVKKGDNVLVNIPLNVGIVGGIIGVAAAPWAVIAAAVAAAGFSCRVELVKKDGDVVEVNARAAEDLGRTMENKARDLGDKARDFGTAVMDGIKDAISGETPVDADFETVVEKTEQDAAPADEPAAPEEPIIIPIDTPEK